MIVEEALTMFQLGVVDHISLPPHGHRLASLVEAVALRTSVPLEIGPEEVSGPPPRLQPSPVYRPRCLTSANHSLWPARAGRSLRRRVSGSTAVGRGESDLGGSAAGSDTAGRAQGRLAFDPEQSRPGANGIKTLEILGVEPGAATLGRE